jgi:hypothetical protein
LGDPSQVGNPWEQNLESDTRQETKEFIAGSDSTPLPENLKVTKVKKKKKMTGKSNQIAIDVSPTQ